jgi:uncharacterized lipoprotein YajG
MFQLRNLPSFMAVIALISTTFFTACKKDATQTVMTDDQKVEAAQQSLQASLYFTSSFSQATNASEKANGFRNDGLALEVRGACTDPSVSPADFITFPKTVVSNYGTGCTDNDGKMKTGKLTLKVGKLWQLGSTIQAIFENYTEDSVKLDGTYTITNNSILGVHNLSFAADNITLTGKNGKTLTYNIRQTHKQVGGFGNLNPLDDVYEISTVMSSVLPDGTKYSWENTTPLKKTNTCWWIQKGTGTIKLNDTAMTIDFGSDTCDNDATLTIGGVVHKIKL